MRNRSVLAVVATGLLALSAAAGCASGGSAGSGSAGSVKDSSITALMEDDPSTTAVQKLLPSFEQQTGIHVNLEVVPYDNLTSKALLAYSQGTGQYDVVFDDWVYGSGFAAKNYIAPLDSYAAKDPSYLKLSDFYGPYLKAVTENGATYGLPIYGESTFLMYRTDLFAKYGISGPPTTMDELRADAEKIYNASGHSVYGITTRGATGIQSVYVWAGFLRAFGGNWETGGKVNVDTPQAVQAADFWSKLLKDYGPPGAADYDWQQNRIEFDQGKAAMTIDATANGPYNEQAQYSSVVGKVGYAPIPNAVANPPASNHSLEVHALYLSSASHNKDAAWKFMSWATSPAVQQQELTLAPQPGLTADSVLHSAAYNKLYGAFVKVMLAQLATGNPDYLPAGADSNTIINSTGTALSQLLSGGISAQSALSNAQKQINEGG